MVLLVLMISIIGCPKVGNSEKGNLVFESQTDSTFAKGESTDVKISESKIVDLFPIYNAHIHHKGRLEYHIFMRFQSHQVKQILPGGKYLV